MQRTEFVNERGGLVPNFFENAGRVVWCQFFFRFETSFVIQFKDTFNLILLSFKVPIERFFHKFFKTGLTF